MRLQWLQPPSPESKSHDAPAEQPHIHTLASQTVPHAMPKRSREEASTLAERLDGEWVGRWVMLKPAAARGKRLPETLVARGSAA